MPRKTYYPERKIEYRSKTISKRQLRNIKKKKRVSKSVSTDILLQWKFSALHFSSLSWKCYSFSYQIGSSNIVRAHRTSMKVLLLMFLKLVRVNRKSLSCWVQVVTNFWIRVIFLKYHCEQVITTINLQVNNTT